MSWARPTDRAVPPTPLATINQVARAARPTPAPAEATMVGLFRRLAGLVGFFRGVGDACREPAFDLLVLAPERAAVLLGMGASLIAFTPSAPSATPAPPGHMLASVAELLLGERGAQRRAPGLGLFVAPPARLRGGGQVRHGDGSAVLVDGDHREVGAVGMPSRAAANVLGVDPDPDLHRGVAGVVDARRERHEVTDMDGVTEHTRSTDDVTT